MALTAGAEAAPAQGAKASARPDLAVAALTGPPRQAKIGQRLRVRVRVINRGRRGAGRSQLRFYLSRNARWSGADAPVRGRRAVGALGSRRRGGKAARLRIPRGAPTLEPLRLIACADATHRVGERNERNNCRAAPGKVIVTDGSSSQLIQAALLRRKLKSDRALLFRLYAAFGDRRLPRRYRSRRSGEGGTAAVGLARERLSSLSPAMKAAVEPFLIPPIYRGSFADPGAAKPPARARAAVSSCELRGSQWENVPTANGGVLVWFRNTVPADRAKASKFAAELDGAIWPTLTGLMGRKPLSDAGYFCDGGDARLDVYLYPIAAQAVTHAVAGCGESPANVIIDPAQPRTTLAHEFMHVLQDAFARQPPCSRYFSVDDATATWAEDKVYPSDLPAEHEFDQLLRYPDLVFTQQHGYPMWAFWYSVTATTGAGAVPAIYRGAADKPPLDAEEAALPGGFAERWPAFARHGWNRPLLPGALTESFFNWDGFPAKPEVRPVAYRLRGEVTTEPLPIELIGLGRQYYHLDLSDRGARRIVFQDPSPTAVDRNLRTHAFFKLAGGRWEGEDWTGREEREFCREDRDEDVRELVIVHSTSTRPRGNGGEQVTSSARPELELRRKCKDPVSLTGSQNQTWSETSTQPNAEGCDTERSGSGTQTMSFDTLPGQASAKVTSTSLIVLGGVALDVARQGRRELREPNPPECVTSADDNSGCGTQHYGSPGPGAPDVGFGAFSRAGRVELSINSPGYFDFPRCPIGGPERTDGNLPFDESRILDSEGNLPESVLRRGRTITVSGGKTVTDVENCGTDPDRCQYGYTFENRRTTTIRWTLVVRR